MQSVQGLYRVWIDGAWISSSVIDPTNFPHVLYYKVSFPSKRTRQIRLLFQGRPAFYGAVTIGDDSISPPQTPIGPKLVTFGDSWVGPTITQPALPPSQTGISGFGEIAGEFFNWDWWEDGLGGSGFINTTYPAQENYVQREQSDLCNTHPGFVIVFGGINDAAYPLPQVEDAVTQFFPTLTSCLPDATIFYLGPQGHTGVESSDVAGAEKFSNVIYYDDIANENWIYGSSTDPSSGNAYLYLNAQPQCSSTPLGHDFIAEKIASYILNRRPDLLPKTFPLFSPAPINGSYSYSAIQNSFLPVGPHQVTVTFTPQDTANYATVTQNATLTVTKASSSLSLSANASTAASGATVSLSSTVSPQIAGVPTGSVSLFDKGILIGSIALDSSGSANFNISSLSAGSHSITATYPGDGNFLPSFNTASTQITIVNPDFSFTVNQQQVTVQPGQASPVSLSVVPLNGFSADLNLSCTGLPAGATCKLASGSQISVQQSITVPVLIQVAASSAQSSIPQLPDSGFTGIAYSGVFGAFIVLRRKTRLRLASGAGAALLCLASLLVFTGCGSSTKTNPPPPATNPPQPKTYNVQLMLTDTVNPSITHSQTISVVIP